MTPTAERLTDSTKPTDPIASCLGVVMLATHFPRPAGDIGNPATWPFPVRYASVPAASVSRIVGGHPDPALLAPFINAAENLVTAGADLITTSCGFLVVWQQALNAALPVPVVTSSLLQIPLLQTALPPGRKIGVITFDSRLLGAAHLAAAGAGDGVVIEGIEQGRELHRVIAEDRLTLDWQAARDDVLDAGLRLQRRVPDLAAVILECTNLPPYAPALRRCLQLPVSDIVTLLTGLRSSLTPASGRHARLAAGSN